jgi:predicted secreted protein
MAITGRELRIWRGNATGPAIIGARSEDLTITIEPIDITDKDDGGFRTLRADFATRHLDCTINGILKDDELLAVAKGAGSALLSKHSIKIDRYQLLNGDFYLNNFQVASPHDNAVTFNASLQSSGAVAVLLASVKPTISGTPTEGEELAGADGTWTLTPTFARQWQRNTGAGWVNISGATSANYTLVTADVGARIRRLTTATVAFGSITIPSNVLGPVAAL